MMRLIISLLLAKIFVFSQSKFDKKNNLSNIYKFSLFPIYEVVDPESLKVVCYAEIPFNSIQFVKQNNNFVGIYQPFWWNNWPKRWGDMTSSIRNAPMCQYCTRKNLSWVHRWAITLPSGPRDPSNRTCSESPLRHLSKFGQKCK